MTFEMISLVTLADPFHLTPPIYWDSPHEIGYWSSSHLITNLKHSLALVANSTASPAFLCHRISYNATAWQINTSVRIKSGRLHLLFAPDFCKITAINGSYASWGGVDFVFERISATAINISISTSTRIRENLCSVDSKSDKINLTIAQAAGGIAISTGYGECGRTSETVNSGFFAFVGETANDDIARQDLLSFAPSRSDYGQESVSYDNHINRKLFKMLVGRSSQKKRRGRIARNVTPGDVLNATDSGEMTKVIFEILSEITERARLALDLQNLRTLLELSGTIHFLRAEKTIVNRKERTREIYDSLIELEVFLNESLAGMRSEVSAEAASADERLVTALEQLMKLETEAQVLIAYSAGERERWLTWNVVLIAICVFEFVDYVVFFLVRRHQTRNFKID
jgi:hypothetical protein